MTLLYGNEDGLRWVSERTHWCMTAKAWKEAVLGGVPPPSWVGFCRYIVYLPSHCQRIETQCRHNTLECDDEEYMEELTCIQLLRRAEHCVQRLRSQFSELLRTAKRSELFVYRQVRNVISFCETSFVVSFFCSLLCLSVH